LDDQCPILNGALVGGELPSERPGPKNVIKIGGNEAEDPAFLARLAKVLAAQDEPPVIVHGGGKTINGILEKLGIQPKFENGQRVTDEKTMEVVEMVLCGTANKRLVRALLDAGVKAMGISGMDSGILKVTVADPALGRVGKPAQVNTQPLIDLAKMGYLPVVAPLGLGPDGLSYNVNADLAAAAVAVALKARQLTFLTNVPGVKINGDVAATMTVAEVLKAIADGQITGGMIPKVQSALDAVAAGMQSVKISNLDTFGDGGTVIRP